MSKLRASTLNVRGRATLAASSLPSYETELLGGENAVRGYESYELGRTTSSVGGTVEVVVPLGGAQPIAFSLFGDAGAGTVRPGNAGTNAFSAPAKGVPTGSSAESMSLSGGAAAGVGLRYGPFRIDYAYNLQGRWKAHVGLVEPS
jgi:outer membrane protein assembly factor BamA